MNKDLIKRAFQVGYATEMQKIAKGWESYRKSHPEEFPQARALRRPRQPRQPAPRQSAGYDYAGLYNPAKQREWMMDYTNADKQTRRDMVKGLKGHYQTLTRSDDRAAFANVARDMHKTLTAPVGQPQAQQPQAPQPAAKPQEFSAQAPEIPQQTPVAPYETNPAMLNNPSLPKTPIRSLSEATKPPVKLTPTVSPAPGQPTSAPRPMQDVNIQISDKPVASKPSQPVAQGPVAPYETNPAMLNNPSLPKTPIRSLASSVSPKVNLLQQLVAAR